MGSGRAGRQAGRRAGRASSSGRSMIWHLQIESAALGTNGTRGVPSGSEGHRPSCAAVRAGGGPRRDGRRRAPRPPWRSVQWLWMQAGVTGARAVAACRARPRPKPEAVKRPAPRFPPPDPPAAEEPMSFPRQLAVTFFFFLKYSTCSNLCVAMEIVSIHHPHQRVISHHVRATTDQ
jgi:hypothetical protein